MKVAFVVHSLAWGGIERILLAQTRDLVRRGVRPTVLCLTGEGPMAPVFRRAGISVRAFAGRSSAHPGAWRGNLRLLRDLVNLFRRERFDGVQTQMFYAGVLGRVAALVASVPIIVHGEHNEYAWKGFLARRLDAWLARRSSAVVVPSRSVATFLARQLGLDLDAITVIPNGVAPPPPGSDVSGLRAAWGVGDDEFVIGMSARLVPQKGHAFFLEVLARLVEDGLSPRAVFMGSGPEERRLRTRVGERGLDGRVLFLGNVEEPRKLLPAMDLVVAPSAREGFGLAVAEAFLAERPVVLSDIPPFREVFGPTGSPLLPLDDAGPWVREIGALMADPARRRELAVSGRRHVETHHGLPAMLESYATLFAGAKAMALEGLGAHV